GVLIVLALCFLSGWCVRCLRGTMQAEAKPCAIAITAALAAAAFHGAVDFVWYIPSYALLLAVLAGLACVLARIQKPNKVITLPGAPRCWVAGAGIAISLVFISWLQISFHHAQGSLRWTEFQLSADGQFPQQDAHEGKTDSADVLKVALNERSDHPIYH